MILADKATVVVSGSRSWSDSEAIQREFDAWESAVQPQSVRFIHGAARGADRLAAYEAARRGWHVEALPAMWEVYGRRAGIVRNLEMLDENPAHVFIFWDGQSRGTKHVIDEVQRRRQSYSIVRSDD